MQGFFDTQSGRIGHAVPLYTTEGMTGARWLELRRKQRQIGCSDIAGVLSLDPRTTPRIIWNSIMGFDDNNDAYESSIGKIIEPLGMAAVGSRFGLQVQRFPWVLKHPQIPLTCNLDAVLEDGTLLEMKWCTRWVAKEWREFGQHHDIMRMQGSAIFAYYMQVQGQLAVTGATSAMLACVCGEEAALRLWAKREGFNVKLLTDDLICHEFDRNDAIIHEIEVQIARFSYWHIEHGFPAPPTRAVDLEYVRRSLRSQPKVTERRDDLEADLAALRQLRAARSGSEEAAKLAEAKFLHSLGHIGEFDIGTDHIGALHKSNKAFYWKGLDPKKPRKDRLGTPTDKGEDDDGDDEG